jgi:hypothetical protein
VEPVHITPDPSEEEREAILGALAAAEEALPTVSPWAEAALPRRGGEEDEP